MGIGYLNTMDYRDTLDRLVIAFCHDYSARKESIRQGTCNKRTRMEYEYINDRIENAAREIVGSYYEIYINEIGNCIGYANSLIDNVCENLYKKIKKEVKINIARKLHLID